MQIKREEISKMITCDKPITRFIKCCMQKPDRLPLLVYNTWQGVLNAQQAPTKIIIKYDN